MSSPLLLIPQHLPQSHWLRAADAGFDSVNPLCCFHLSNMLIFITNTLVQVKLDHFSIPLYPLQLHIPLKINSTAYVCIIGFTIPNSHCTYSFTLSAEPPGRGGQVLGSHFAAGEDRRGGFRPEHGHRTGRTRPGRGTCVALSHPYSLWLFKRLWQKQAMPSVGDVGTTRHVLRSPGAPSRSRDNC